MKAATRFDPMPVKAMQVDGVASALSQAELASQTLGLALRACGTVHQMTFPSPDNSPYALIGTADTYTDFILGDTADEQHIDTFHIPWYFQESQEDIIAEVRIATVQEMPLQLRVYVDEMPGLAALATTNSEDSDVQYAYDAMESDAWKRYDWGDKTRTKSTLFTVRIPSPTVPANRYCALFPQLKTVSAATNPIIEAAGSWKYFIESFRAYDVCDLRTYGNG